MSSQILPRRCPSCELRLEIAKLRCESCSTIIEGKFSLPRLARLSREDQQFIELLVLADGSLKEVAKKLNVSYPTLRKRLDELVERLGQEIQSDEDRRNRPGTEQSGTR